MDEAKGDIRIEGALLHAGALRMFLNIEMAVLSKDYSDFCPFPSDAVSAVSSKNSDPGAARAERSRERERESAES